MARKSSKEPSFFPILHNQKVVAVIIRHFHSVNNLQFFTPDENPLQVGIHNKSAGWVVAPHVHTAQNVQISEVHEVFYIVSGQVRLTMYDHTDGEVIESVILNAGDSVVHMGEGHGLEFLKDTILFEVKQGPYFGVATSKVYLGDGDKPKQQVNQPATQK